MKPMKKIGATTLLALLGLVPMVYNSCSADHDGGLGASSSLSKAGGCDLQPYFEATYHPFLVQNCASCHRSGSTGKGAFGDSNVAVAWEAFNITGYSKISGHAVNPGHNSPYTGEHHQEKVNELLLEWARAEEEQAICLGEADSLKDPVDVTNWTSTRSKAINAVDDKAVVVRWDLGKEILNPPPGYPDLTGAFFEVKIKTDNALNRPYYIVTEPTLDLSKANFDLTVRGLKIKINGEFVPNETTFTYMERAVRRGGGANTSLSAGSLIAQGTLRASDVIALAFAELDNSELPPAPPGAKVNFSLASQNAAKEGGFVTVDVTIDQPVKSHSVTVGLEVDGLTDAVNIKSDRRIRNEDGDMVTIRNFDWDYAVDKMSLVFLPNEVKKTITIQIADDDRYELKSGENEKVVLRIGTVQGAEIGSQASTKVIIPDDDVAPDPMSDVMTFSQLMSPGGVLFDHCLTCHNSEDKRGGYDLTNYQEMIDRGVLIPGDAQSKMYIRMSVASPSADPMPLVGLLPSFQRREVEKWIIDGAKNN